MVGLCTRAMNICGPALVHPDWILAACQARYFVHALMTIGVGQNSYQHLDRHRAIFLPAWALAQEYYQPSTFAQPSSQLCMHIDSLRGW